MGEVSRSFDSGTNSEYTSPCCYVGPCQQRVRQARHVARLNARLAYYEWRTQVLMSQQQQLAETRARLERVRLAYSKSMTGRC